MLNSVTSLFQKWLKSEQLAKFKAINKLKVSRTRQFTLSLLNPLVILEYLASGAWKIRICTILQPRTLDKIVALLDIGTISEVSIESYIMCSLHMYIPVYMYTYMTYDINF